MPSLEELIQGCIDRDPKLMEQFYHRFAPEMWVVCLRYAKNTMMAEDVMQEGFIRAFEVIGSFGHKGSFQGWLRRVFVTTAINHLKKYYRFDRLEQQVETVFSLGSDQTTDAISNMQGDQLLEMLSELPEGFKTVFNLFVIEGYSHREIAEILDCSEGNSRSQLHRARICLQKVIEQLEGLRENQTLSSEEKKNKR
jgi:RNA polymerase sigma factor (sigma-70 family)